MILTRGEVALHYYDLMQRGKAEERTISPDGSVIGACNDNPILNSMPHDVEFEDGDIKELMANTIAENMLTRTDADGNVAMELETMLNYSM